MCGGFIPAHHLIFLNIAHGKSNRALPYHPYVGWGLGKSTIASMLAVPEYCGDVINFKTFPSPTR